MLIWIHCIYTMKYMNTCNEILFSLKKKGHYWNSNDYFAYSFIKIWVASIFLAIMNNTITNMDVLHRIFLFWHSKIHKLTSVLVIGMVWTFMIPQKLYVEILTSKVKILEDGAWEVIKSWGQNFHKWNWYPSERAPAGRRGSRQYSQHFGRLMQVDHKVNMWNMVKPCLY